MDKQQVLETIRKCGVMPVVRSATTAEARRVCRALIAGGINVLEITLTVPDAAGLIGELAARYANEAVIGAGTVLNCAAAQACAEAGAQFVVSPLLDAETVAFCRRNAIVVMPGALTPTEIFAAHRAGADAVKIFPASAAGGTAYLTAVKAVFPHVEMVPTGGVTPENAAEYLRAGAFAVGIGGALTADEPSVIETAARNLRARLGDRA